MDRKLRSSARFTATLVVTTIVGLGLASQTAVAGPSAAAGRPDDAISRISGFHSVWSTEGSCDNRGRTGAARGEWTHWACEKDYRDRNYPWSLYVYRIG